MDMVRDMMTNINIDGQNHWNAKVASEEAERERKAWEEQAWEERVDLAKDLLAMAGFIFAFIFVMVLMDPTY